MRIAGFGLRSEESGEMVADCRESPRPRHGSRHEALSCGLPRVLRVVIAVITCAIALGGCHRLASGPTSTIEKAIYTDELGRKVEIAPHPQRIVSLAPSLTETLFAVGAGKQIVGVTSYCDYPEDAKRIERVGDTLNPNIERLASLRPDLVLITTSSQLEQFARKLDSLGIPLYVIDPKSIDEVAKSAEEIGKVTGHAGEGAAVASKMRERTEEIARRVRNLPKKRVFFIVGMEPLFTIGRDAFLTDMIDRAGGDSITKNVAPAWPQYSREAVIAGAPGVIIAGGSTPAFEKVTDTWTEMFAATPAGRHGDIYRVNNDLVQRPAPRIVDGLELLARILHPEAFR